MIILRIILFNNTIDSVCATAIFLIIGRKIDKNITNKYSYEVCRQKKLATNLFSQTFRTKLKHKNNNIKLFGFQITDKILETFLDKFSVYRNNCHIKVYTNNSLTIPLSPFLRYNRDIDLQLDVIDNNFVYFFYDLISPSNISYLIILYNKLLSYMVFKHLLAILKLELLLKNQEIIDVISPDEYSFLYYLIRLENNSYIISRSEISDEIIPIKSISNIDRDRIILTKNLEYATGKDYKNLVKKLADFKTIDKIY